MAKSNGAPAKRTKTAGELPSRQDILDFLATATGEAGEREIARAFGVKGGDRIALKALLRDMADDGLIAGSRRKLIAARHAAARDGARDRLGATPTASSSPGPRRGTRSTGRRPAS